MEIFCVGLFCKSFKIYIRSFLDTFSPWATLLLKFLSLYRKVVNIKKIMTWNKIMDFRSLYKGWMKSS